MLKRLMNGLTDSLALIFNLILVFVIGIATYSIVDLSNGPIDTQEKFDTLVTSVMSRLNIKDQDIKIYLDQEDDINAYAVKTMEGTYEVHMFRGIVEFADNADQVAMVFGHELAHHLLGHTEAFVDQKASPPIMPSAPSNPMYDRYSTSIQHELMSDLLGSQLAKAAGYNPCEGVKLWAKMKDKFGDEPSSSHPTPSQRMEQLNRVYQCNLI